jgi:chromate reductase
MTKITGFSGSLRKVSFSAALLRAAGVPMPGGSGMTIGTIRDIALYDGDEEGASAATRQ